MIEQSVGIIGVGRLGSDVALTLAERDLCDIVLYDREPDRARYLAADLSDTSFGHVYNRRVSWAARIGDLASCDVILVAAGARLTPETGTSGLLAANLAVADELATAFVGSSKLFVVATEPVDLMTAALRRLLNLPAGRVVGIGGVVDSFRLRHIVADALDVSPDFVSTQVIGPNGPEASALWRFTAVNGVPVSALASGEALAEMERSFAADAATRASRMAESFSRYAPAMACFELLRSIIKDDRRVMSVTMEWSGLAGISDVAMSVPALLGRFGVERTYLPELSQEALTVLRRQAKNLATASEVPA